MPQTNGYTLIKDTESDDEGETSRSETKSGKERRRPNSPSSEGTNGTEVGTKLSQSRTSATYGSIVCIDADPDCTTPLLPKESDVRPDGDTVDNNADEEEKPAKKESWLKTTERFWSVMVFLLPLVTGCVLNIAMNVDTDTIAREITPAVFHSYIVCLIIIFGVWLVVEKLHHNYKESNISDRDKYEPLIPRHLLDGLAVFAVCNCIFQVFMCVDILKCSRSVSGLDKSYVVSAVFEIFFLYCQIYVFYSLSRRREEKLWFGNYFTMFTLAINLTLWVGYFTAGAVKNSNLEHVSWLRRYHYGLKEDLCANSSYNNGSNSRRLHNFVQTLLQYKFTFAMEYSLLASALLYHLWVEIATPSAGEFAATNKRWAVWRFGFICGLFCLPLIGVVCAYSSVKYKEKHQYKPAYLYICTFLLWCPVFACSIKGLCLLTRHYKRVSDYKTKVDTKLLCLSALGFVILDLFTIFATTAEIVKSYNGGYIVLLGLSSFGELVTCSVLTVFIYAMYFHEVRPTDEGIKAAKSIRQIASFCLTVSIGFWVMRTYTFRSKQDFDYVCSDYFGKTIWFVVQQLATPMCIYFHYHCAICLSGSIADNS
ncbi:proton channel OTOP2-like [Dendronephthya gigantea]|uniref:proton channel OTOP2-like n=1 Tax=Dendronephthya gigantea TaxID=151771 RepID=UPI0010695154|nr:proton channel OTOP2-like [Dendronephthya gigantea]